MLSPFETDLIVKLLISAMLGGLIGLEREVHKKPGGLRMHALVCMGSTLFTISSVYFNVAHIAAGIVGGIGFLGAGTIFRADNRIHGLTTAAELWALAAIGIAVGIGFFTAAFVATLIVLIIMGPMKMFEKEPRGGKKERY